MSDDKAKRKKLRRPDWRLMLAHLENLGFAADVFRPRSCPEVCVGGKPGVGGRVQFVWDEHAGAWRFDRPAIYLHTFADFEEAVSALEDDGAAITEMETAWQKYEASRTEQKWLEYVGTTFVAFVRPGDPNNNPD